MGNSLKTYTWNSQKAEKRKGRKPESASFTNPSMGYVRLGDAGTHDYMTRCAKLVLYA